MATLHTLLKIGADISDLQAGVSKGVAALDSMERNTSKLTTTLGSMGKSLIGAFAGFQVLDMAVGAVKSLALEAFESAGNILDLSNKTGLTTETIQRMGFVAEQTGSSVEAFTRAAFMLGVNLEKGSGQVRGLGLSFEELKRLRPDEQFATVVRALEAMEDPQERNRIAVELFGKAAQEILPSIAEGYSAIADQAKVSERAQLEALDRASDAWDAFVKNTKTSVTSWLGEQVQGWQQMRSLTSDQRTRLEQLQRTGLSTGEALKKLFPPDVNLAAEKITRTVSDASNTLFNLGGIVIPPTKTQLKSLSDETKKSAQAMEEFAAKITKANQAAGNQSAFQASLRSLQQLVRENTEELMLIQPVTMNWASANQQTTQTLLGLVQAGALHRQMTAEEISAMLQATQTTMTWRDSLTELAQSMTQLSQTANNSVVSALASVVNALSVATKAVDSLRAGFAAMTSGGGLTSILSGLAGMVGGIGGLISAAQTAINIGKALFNIFDRDKGRDLVKDFVKEFGGFDAVRELLNQLGDEGERLWIQLTQGDAHGNPEAARRAIEAVREALERLKSSAAGGVSITYHPPGIEVEEGGGIPALARGGIVTRPTLALMGEGGPEAVIPLSRMGGMGGGPSQIVIPVSVGGRHIETIVVDTLSRAVRRNKHAEAA